MKQPTADDRASFKSEIDKSSMIAAAQKTRHHWTLPRVAGLLIGFLLASSAYAQAPIAPWGRGESKGENLVVSLVTFGPGPDVPSWFGHTALVVEDLEAKQGRLYNYGMFSFDETMLARFAMGRLTFWVGEAGAIPTFRMYQEEGRAVRIQQLNLSPEARVKLARMLADNVLPQNRDYLYHHYNDNCSTRPRDMIDRAIDGQLKAATAGPARMTLREHTRRYSSAGAPMSLLLDFLMNDEIDQPITTAEEAFLPAELEHQVAQVQYRNTEGQTVPLVASTSVFSEGNRAPTPDQPPRYAPWLLLIGLLVGAVPVVLALRPGLSRWPARALWGLWNVLIGLVLGLPGLALFIMGTVTEHTVTWWNENLLLANPLTFLTFPLGLALIFGARWARRGLLGLWVILAVTGTLAVVVKVLPPFDQDNWRLIALILPISCGMAASFVLDRRARASQVSAAPEAPVLKLKAG